MHRALLLFSIAVLCGCDLFGPRTATVRGVVADAETGMPVQSIYVQVGTYVSCGVFGDAIGCREGFRRAGRTRTEADGTWSVRYDVEDGVDRVGTTCVFNGTLTCDYLSTFERLPGFRDGDTLLVTRLDAP